MNIWLRVRMLYSTLDILGPSSGTYVLQITRFPTPNSRASSGRAHKLVRCPEDPLLALELVINPAIHTEPPLWQGTSLVVSVSS